MSDEVFASALQFTERYRMQNPITDRCHAGADFGIFLGNFLRNPALKK